MLTVNKMWNRKAKCRQTLPNAPLQTRLKDLVFIEKPNGIKV